ncbi:hypothetical protein GCM10012319_23420 [Comamonas sp. KCTC 72670]|nr:hypothetical protein GCM10012319_23420 [Comamonas sp. KCTC 72670]
MSRVPLDAGGSIATNGLSRAVFRAGPADFLERPDTVFLIASLPIALGAMTLGDGEDVRLENSLPGTTVTFHRRLIGGAGYLSKQDTDRAQPGR